MTIAFPFEELTRLLRVGEPTFVGSARALVFAVVASFVAFELRSRWRVVDFVYRPVLIFTYSLPAYALALFAGAAGFPGSCDWLLVGLTLIIPIETAIANGAAEADSFDRSGVGTAQGRFLHIRLPALVPALLNGLAMAVPWALLGTMLLEVAQGNNGLGLRLATDGLLGLAAQLPIVAIIALVSGGGFFCLAAGSHWTRVKLGLTSHLPRSVMLPPKNIDFGPAMVCWGLLIIGLSWWAMHWRYPIMVAGPLDRSAVRTLLPDLFYQIAQTIMSTVVGTGLGLLVGVLGAVSSLIWPPSRRILEALLLPIQIVPLQVFAPFLLVFALATTDTGGASALSIIMDWPALTIGALASAYISLQYLSAWLTILPGRSSGILRAHNRGNPHVLRFVYLPWLAKGTSAFLPALLPRTLLAVLVTEYLVTQRGLGGAMGQLRGLREFHQSFVILMRLIIVTFIMQTIFTICSHWTYSYYTENLS